MIFRFCGSYFLCASWWWCQHQWTTTTNTLTVRQSHFIFESKLIHSMFYTIIDTLELRECACAMMTFKLDWPRWSLWRNFIKGCNIKRNEFLRGENDSLCKVYSACLSPPQKKKWEFQTLERAIAMWWE